MRRALVLSVVLAWAAQAAPSLGPPQQVTPAAGPEGQSQAQLTGTADGFFVVWQAGVGRNAKVRGARLLPDGRTVDPAGLTVAEGAGGRFEPAVAFGHGVALVVWGDLRDGVQAVYGARVSPQGVVLDPGGVLLSTEPGARMPAVAATGSGFLVAWAQAVEGGQGTEARARLLGPTGAPSAAPLRLSTARPWRGGEDFAHSVIARAYCQNLRIAVVGQDAYVVWTGNGGDGQLIEPTRAVVDTVAGQVVVGPSARALPQGQSRTWAPSVSALGDGGVLLAWTDFRGRGNLGLEAHNALVSAPRSVDAGTTLVSLQADGGAREVLWPATAPSSVVAFVQGVDNPQRDRRREWRLRVREVLPDGTTVGPDVTVPEQVAWPALAVGPGGVTLLVTTTVNGAAGETGRLQARVVSR